MRAILLGCLLLSSALAVDQDTRVIASPDTRTSVRYVWVADDAGGEAYTHTAILQRGEELPWSFSARGRAMQFSWSPDGRHLLVGVVKPGKDMSLHYVDARQNRPAELDLRLEAIEEQVSAALPERDPSRGERVAFASHHQIDFERIKWSSPNHCQLHYKSAFDRKAGEAVLTLDLTQQKPALVIQSIVPRGAE